MSLIETGITFDAIREVSPRNYFSPTCWRASSPPVHVSSLWRGRTRIESTADEGRRCTRMHADWPARSTGRGSRVRSAGVAGRSQAADSLSAPFDTPGDWRQPLTCYQGEVRPGAGGRCAGVCVHHMNREDGARRASAQPMGQRREAIHGQDAARSGVRDGCGRFGVHPLNREGGARPPAACPAGQHRGPIRDRDAAGRGAVGGCEGLGKNPTHREDGARRAAAWPARQRRGPIRARDAAGRGVGGGCEGLGKNPTQRENGARWAPAWPAGQHRGPIRDPDAAGRGAGGGCEVLGKNPTQREDGARWAPAWPAGQHRGPIRDRDAAGRGAVGGCEGLGKNPTQREDSACWASPRASRQSEVRQSAQWPLTGTNRHHSARIAPSCLNRAVRTKAPRASPPRVPADRPVCRDALGTIVACGKPVSRCAQSGLAGVHEGDTTMRWV